MTHYPNHCIHRAGPLCPDCQRDADEDPDAWTTHGNHPAGLAQFAADQRERAEWIAQQPDDTPRDDSEIPF
jgi:hypothetical protein